MLIYKKIIEYLKNYFKKYKIQLLKTTAVFVSFCILSNVLVSLEKVESAVPTYQTWKQTDPKWGDKWLCSNRYELHTMAQIGCAATSAAILAVHSGCVSETTFNPGILCDYLYANGGFDDDGDILWSKIQGLVPDFKYQGVYNIGSPTKEKLVSELSNLLNQGFYIILTCKANNGHWVAVDKIVGNDIYIMDPGSNTTLLFSRYYYGNCTTARLFKGKNSPATPITPDPNPEPTPDLGYYSVNATSLNHRSGPSTSFTSNAVIPQGTFVQVTEIQNNWGKFVYNEKVGWSSLEYLDKVLMGDLNSDGKVDKKDASIILAYRRSQYTLTQKQFYAADMNYDGVVDLADGAKITKIAIR